MLIEYLMNKAKFKTRADLEKAKHYIELLIEMETRYGTS